MRLKKKTATISIPTEETPEKESDASMMFKDEQLEE